MMDKGRIVIEIDSYMDATDITHLDDMIPKKLAALLITGVYVNTLTNERIDINLPYSKKKDYCTHCGQEVVLPWD